MTMYQAFMIVLIAIHIAIHIVSGGWSGLFGASFIACLWLYFEYQIKLAHDEFDAAYEAFDRDQRYVMGHAHGY